MSCIPAKDFTEDTVTNEDAVLFVSERLIDADQYNCLTLVPQVAVDAHYLIQALSADAMRFRKLCVILKAAQKCFPNPLETSQATVLCSVFEQPKTVAFSVAWETEAFSPGTDLRKAIDDFNFESMETFG